MPRRYAFVLLLLFVAAGSQSVSAQPPFATLASAADEETVAQSPDDADLSERLLRAERRLKQLESLTSEDIPPDPGETPALADDILRRLEALESGHSQAAAKKAADSSKPSMKWSGRVHTDYWAFPGQSPGEDAFETGDAFDSVDDRFLFRRLRIGVQGSIPDFMLYKLEVDFNNPESPQLKDNYIGWEDMPYLQTVLLGNQKRPYGLDHINSSRYNVFLERPAVIEALNQDSRRFGLASYGFSEDLRYNWRYGAYMGRDMQNVGTVTATPMGGVYQAEIAGRFASTLFYECEGRNYAHFALAGTLANTDGNASSAVSTARFQSRPEARTSGRWLDTGVIAGAQGYEIGALESVLNLGALQIVGEYQNAWVQRDGYDDVAFQGGYVYAAYFLTGEHTPWERETGQLGRVKPFHNFFWVRDEGDLVPGWGAWQVAARYSHADFTDADIQGGIEDNMTLGLNWWWNPYARLQFNYIYGKIRDRRPIDGFTEGDYHILGTRICVDF